MNPSDNKKWHTLLMAALCVIIVLGLGILFWNPAHSVVNMYLVPVGEWSGFSFGTCGNDDIPMTSTSTIPQAYNESFLYRFGEPEPAAAPALPPMIDYPLRKDAIDTLMARAEVNGSEESVIGLYEFPDTRILLVKSGKNVTEVLAKNDSVRTLTLVSLAVGSLHSEAAAPGPAQSGAYTTTSVSDVVIRRIDPVLPGGANSTFSLYIVQKDQEDTCRDTDGTAIATIKTDCTFYVLYNQRVERVVTGSSAVPGPGWTLCSENAAIEGSGSAMASLKHTVRLAKGSDDILLANLIRTGAAILVSEGNMGSTTMRISRGSTGCSC
ncbi:hypothetical protein [Methanoregula sp.]|jgi:hypothetical protein|uniref:hypothetical protein n=1 Tax=Methanoregula sp. TaxID=2052170 RepID=UPI003569F588